MLESYAHSCKQRTSLQLHHLAGDTNLWAGRGRQGARHGATSLQARIKAHCLPAGRLARSFGLAGRAPTSRHVKRAPGGSLRSATLLWPWPLALAAGLPSSCCRRPDWPPLDARSSKPINRALNSRLGPTGGDEPRRHLTPPAPSGGRLPWPPSRLPGGVPPPRRHLVAGASERDSRNGAQLASHLLADACLHVHLGPNWARQASCCKTLESGQSQLALSARNQDSKQQHWRAGNSWPLAKKPARLLRSTGMRNEPGAKWVPSGHLRAATRHLELDLAQYFSLPIARMFPNVSNFSPHPNLSLASLAVPAVPSARRAPVGRQSGASGAPVERHSVQFGSWAVVLTSELHREPSSMRRT